MSRLTAAGNGGWPKGPLLKQQAELERVIPKSRSFGGEVFINLWSAPRL